VNATVAESTKAAAASEIPDGTASVVSVASTALPAGAESAIWVRIRDEDGDVAQRPFQVIALC
jgi:hypothetical protein